MKKMNVKALLTVFALILTASEAFSAMIQHHQYTPDRQGKATSITPKGEEKNGIAQNTSEEIKITADVPSMGYLESKNSHLHFSFTKLFETRTATTSFKVLANTPHEVEMSTTHTLVHEKGGAYIPFDVQIDETEYKSGQDYNNKLTKDLDEKKQTLFSISNIDDYGMKEHNLTIAMNNAATLHGFYEGRIVLTISAKK